MTTHSSILAWEIPRTEEPGGLQSNGSQRVRHFMLYRKVVKRVNPKSSHHTENILYLFL